MSTLTSGAEGLKRRGFSFDEIEAMQTAGILDPDEKFEVIEGEIVPMNSQNMPHMIWKARIARWIYAHLPQNLVLVPEGTLRLRDRPRANTFETDLLIFEPGFDPDAIRPAMVRLAIEVSDTTRERDLRIKAPLYGAGGVAELWVVDVPRRETVVHRDPRKDGYASVAALPFEAALTALFDPGLALRLADLEAPTG